MATWYVGTKIMLGEFSCCVHVNTTPLANRSACIVQSYHCLKTTLKDREIVSHDRFGICNKRVPFNPELIDQSRMCFMPPVHVFKNDLPISYA